MPGVLTSVALTKASTTGESLLLVCVPAAAAATKPKLAAAARTRALVLEALRALTVMSWAAYSSLKPVMLLLTGASPLRPDQARVVVSMVLKAFAPPPAKDKPTLAEMATAVAVEEASMLADSRATMLIEFLVESSSARSA